jgi:hypothetical protein
LTSVNGTSLTGTGVFGATSMVTAEVNGVVVDPAVAAAQIASHLISVGPGRSSSVSASRRAAAHPASFTAWWARRLNTPLGHAPCIRPRAARA